MIIKSDSAIKISTVVLFFAMILVNALANTIPINGFTTGEVSNLYSNLFAPASITFSVWGLIYLLLGIFAIYQLGFFRDGTDMGKRNLIRKVDIYFSISSIMNMLWILSWHNLKIGFSVIFIVGILICLILIINLINKEQLSNKEKFFIKLPFSVYFGWITIATIANITTWLVKLEWDRFGISEPVWTIIILLIGLLIGTITMFRNNKDIAYGLILIWAYIGILIKHISLSGFAGKYSNIMITTIVSIAILVISEIYMIISKLGLRESK